FSYSEWERVYMQLAKELLIQHPNAFQWNHRVVLTNYESSYLVGQGYMDEGLNLLLEVYFGINL
ncbi:MAG: hypothetical protein ACK466_22445, partial [Pseudanabaena sp.]